VGALRLAQDPEADRLLSENPFALLVGMVLDQQIPLERAFRAPLELAQRLGGTLDAATVAATDPDRLAALFAKPPALHRFPSAMAERVRALASAVEQEYGGEPTRIWQGATSGEELLDRVRRLPGFGEQKARIFVALLGKQLGVRPPGWEQACAPYSARGSFLSVADIDGPESLAKVRDAKRALKQAGSARGSGTAVRRAPRRS
jgi:uncharacterized HhH-GPD family protein